MTKQELRRYQHIVSRIKELKAEREEMISLVRPLDGMPHGGGVSDPTANAGAKLADLAAKIEDEIRLLDEERAQIMAAISQLNDTEHDIMYYHYIRGWRWWKVAEKMGYSERQIHRIHGVALLKIK